MAGTQRPPAGLARSATPAPGARVRPQAVCLPSFSRPGGGVGEVGGSGLRGPVRALRLIGVVIVVVPVPPVVRRALRVALGRVLPGFLPPERAHVEVAPGAAHRLVAAVVE